MKVVQRKSTNSVISNRSKSSNKSNLEPKDLPAGNTYLEEESRFQIINNFVCQQEKERDQRAEIQYEKDDVESKNDEIDSNADIPEDDNYEVKL